MINVEKVQPSGIFTNYIFKAIPLAFDESMSYYETLAGLLAYLKDTILPAVNNNADALIEVQNLITQLQEYVDNYFTNLDVQEEINNKLDEMVEQGTLQEIIADYLNSKAVFGFDTIANLKEATNLIDGSYAQTLGYHAKNDDGGALYKIRTITNEDVVNEMNIISLDDNTLIAELIDKELNVKQLSAYGDNSHDDTNVFDFALNNYKHVIVPDGIYLINDTITINEQVNLIGYNKNKSIIKINSDKDGFLLNKGFIEINNLEFLCISDYSHSILKTMTPSNIANQIIRDCFFVGDNNTGNGIEIYGNNSYGLMQGIIEKCTFNKLYNGIYVNLTETSWNSACKINDCWEWNCVYGLNYNASSNGTNGLYISNFKGQYNGVTDTLINNLIGTGITIDNCFIWDGGYTLKISKNAKYTTVRSLNITAKSKLVDHGFRTRIENIDINTGQGRYYEFKDDFFGNSLTRYTIVKSDEASVVNDMVQPVYGQTRPAIKLTTGAITNNYAICKLNMLCLNETAPWDLEFDLHIGDLTNVTIYVGGDIGNGTNPQGNFISLDTAVDNKLRAVDKGSSGVISTSDLINNPANNVWYHCQIKYLSQTECLFFIDGNYITTIDAHRYQAQPYFYIKTLENVDKTLAIANLYMKTYIY